MSYTRPKFYNRPPPEEGPRVPYENHAAGNPVVRGVALAILSSVIGSISWIQKILWKSNRLDQLKNLPSLATYEPRYDPTVIPRSADHDEVLSTTALPRSRVRANDLAYYTSTDFYNAYSSGRLTPLEVAEYLLSIIQRDGKKTDRHSVAFLEVRADLVRKAAQASAERYKNGTPLSPLDGVPVAVKDEVDLKGYHRTLASKLDFTNSKDETGWCIAKWEEAGAVVIGKTIMHEIGLDTTNNNPNFGTPLNPHNEKYYTGGSSGGSACAVAQGICPIAHGADGGGSIRLPSAFCGIWGLKPSHGRVSGRPTADLAVSVGVMGPMASNLDDLALAYRIMAQPDPVHKSSALFPNALGKDLLEGSGTAGPTPATKKVLGIDQDWVRRSDPLVLSMFEDVVSFLTEDRGYEIVDVSIPLLPENQKAHALTILSEVRMGLSHADIKKLTYPNQMLLNVVGDHAMAQDFFAAQRLRDMVMKHLSWLWEKHPGMMVLTPTTPCAGWRISHPTDITSGYGVSDGNMSLRAMEYVFLANWTGAPAVSCPMGYSEENVPCGIMAMSEWGGEEQLLSFGKDVEEYLGKDGTRRPKEDGHWVDVLTSSQKI